MISSAWRAVVPFCLAILLFAPTVWFAFRDEVSDDLRYARRVPGVGWVHGVVDDGGANNVGLYPSLAFDRYERPAISYYDITNGDLKYARFNGSSWIIESPDTSSA